MSLSILLSVRYARILIGIGALHVEKRQPGSTRAITTVMNAWLTLPILVLNVVILVRA
jgi:hypothetical protein